MVDSDEARELRQIGKDVATILTRIAGQEDELDKLRIWRHSLSNDATPVIMGFPGVVVRLGAAEVRVTATEMRLAAVEGVPPRVERLEQSMIIVRDAAADTGRKVQTTGAILLGIFNRVWPIATALLIAYLVIRLKLR